MIWVLEDPRAGTAVPSIGIAERLGLPFRRLRMKWTWKAHVAALVPNGSLMGVTPEFSEDLPTDEVPSLVISAGRRSAPVALWLKARYGCKLVHCMSPGWTQLYGRDQFDLLVISAHDRPAPAQNVMTILGGVHRVSPDVLSKAEDDWGERLGHLPRPRVALIVGGKVRQVGMPPQLAHDLGRQVAMLSLGMGGSVMATTSRRTGEEASNALAEGLGPSMHTIYRWGEPDANPYLGYLALADAIIVTADSVSMISEACATTSPVFVALPELAGPRHRMMIDTLVKAGHVRPFSLSFSSWDRQPLDEGGRVAEEVRRRFHLD